MNRISMEGSYAPTRNELIATRNYLDSLIDDWPFGSWTKEQQAVARFAGKVRSLCTLHDLAQRDD